MKAGRSTGSPFTYDDLVDLHFLLQADELSLELMESSLPIDDVLRSRRDDAAVDHYS